MMKAVQMESLLEWATNDENEQFRQYMLLRYERFRARQKAYIEKSNIQPTEIVKYCLEHNRHHRIIQTTIQKAFSITQSVAMAFLWYFEKASREGELFIIGYSFYKIVHDSRNRLVIEVVDINNILVDHS